MKRFLFLIFLILFSYKLMHIPSSFDAHVGRLPVLHDGRVKPLDSLARHELLKIQGRLKLANDMSPINWYFNLLTSPTFGSNLDIILVEHPKLFDSVDSQFLKQKYRVSEQFLDKNIEIIVPFIKSASQIEKEERTPIQQASFLLSQRYATYKNIRFSFFPTLNNSSLDFWNQMILLTQSLDEKNIESSTEFLRFLSLYNQLSEFESNLFFVFDVSWKTLPQAALDPNQSQGMLLSNYLLLADAFQDGDELKVKSYSTQILDAFQSFSLTKSLIVQLEYYFNVINPFIVSLFLYLLIVFLVFLSRFFALKYGHVFNQRYLAT